MYQEILRKLQATKPTSTQTNSLQTALSSFNLAEERLKVSNDVQGDLKGLDCPICKNKGVVFHLKNGYEVAVECECMPKRRSLRRIKRSGMQELIEQYTFDSYKDDEKWQKIVKLKALRFIDDHDRKWFYIGGQVGAGKTHICTAIVSAFLDKGIEARYMLWRDDSVKIKAVVNDDTEYFKLVNPLKTVPILYVDDLFKTSSNLDGSPKSPTPADINLAFEIFNYRYANNLVTVISSERTIQELIACDEAVGSRIYQRARGCCCNLEKDPRRNYRLRGDGNSD